MLNTNNPNLTNIFWTHESLNTNEYFFEHELHELNEYLCTRISQITRIFYTRFFWTRIKRITRIFLNTDFLHGIFWTRITRIKRIFLYKNLRQQNYSCYSSYSCSKKLVFKKTRGQKISWSKEWDPCAMIIRVQKTLSKTSKK